MNVKEIKQKLKDLSKQEAQLTQEIKSTLLYLDSLKKTAFELSGKHKLLEELYEEQSLAEKKLEEEKASLSADAEKADAQTEKKEDKETA